MKARVFVTLKSTVLDPQGQTVRAALNGLGHTAIAGVRQGKYFEYWPILSSKSTAWKYWTRPYMCRA
jgi:phosphoribosylformylglycinamidine synthase PurS subunit